MSREVESVCRHRKEAQRSSPTRLEANKPLNDLQFAVAVALNQAPRGVATCPFAAILPLMIGALVFDMVCTARVCG